MSTISRDPCSCTWSGSTGSEDAYQLRRESDDRVEFVVLTLWDTMEAIHQFAGHDPRDAVAEAAAREVLTRCA